MSHGERVGDHSRSRTDRETTVSARIFGCPLSPRQIRAASVSEMEIIPQGGYMSCRFPFSCQEERARGGGSEKRAGLSVVLFAIVSEHATTRALPGMGSFTPGRKASRTQAQMANSRVCEFAS